MSVAAATLPFSPSVPLLPRVAAGDDTAMQQLMRHFTPFVRSIGRRMGTAASNADDLVQETMLRLWRFADRFDPARGTEPTFIAAVARNAAIDIARHEARRPAVPTDEIGELGPPSPSATDLVPTLVTVHAALAELRPCERELLRLAYFEHLTQPEIAVRLGLPLGTVKSRTFHAFRTLRAILGEIDAR